jgi:hypothetical protein
MDKPVMKEGYQKPIQAEMLGELLYDGSWKGRKQADLLKEFLLPFYHVDTYESKGTWRIQGYIYTIDIPKYIPQIVVEADAEVNIRKSSRGISRPVIQLWSMTIKPSKPI